MYLGEHSADSLRCQLISSIVTLVRIVASDDYSNVTCQKVFVGTSRIVGAVKPCRVAMLSRDIDILSIYHTVLSRSTFSEFHRIALLLSLSNPTLFVVRLSSSHDSSFEDSEWGSGFCMHLLWRQKSLRDAATPDARQLP